MLQSDETRSVRSPPQRQAQSVRPLDVARCHRAVPCWLLAQVQGALRDFDEVVNADPANVGARIQRGVLRAVFGDAEVRP